MHTAHGSGGRGGRDQFLMAACLLVEPPPLVSVCVTERVTRR